MLRLAIAEKLLDALLRLRPQIPQKHASFAQRRRAFRQSYLFGVLVNGVKYALSLIADMDYSLEFGNFWSTRAQSFLVPLCEEDSRPMPARVREALAKAKQKKLFSAKEGEPHVFENTVFVGFCKEPDSFEKAVGSAWPKIKALGVESCAVLADAAGQVYDAVLGLENASYSFDQFKKEKTPASVKLLLYTKDHGAAASLKKAKIVSKAVRRARDLANQPSNIATPEFMAGEAKKIAKESGLVAHVLDENALRKQGFGALLAVGRGSDVPPRLVVLEYAVDRKKPWLVFVGKGVTFDSGGISIKPSADLDKMKFDKAGACAVLAAMSVLKELKVETNVAGVLPFAENVPSGKSYKPGDVVTSHSGKTIEVLNTDAEGRLVLADALSYSLKAYKPIGVVDVATLTSACVVALGDVYAGLFSNVSSTLPALQKLSEQAGERCWPMPLTREYEEKIKGEVGEVKNIGDAKGYAGAITGAAFLKQFVGETPWAHVDIAGVAYNSSPKPHMAVGATGFGARLLLKIAEQPNVFKQVK